MRLSIRSKLTMWYGLVMAAVLVVFGAGVFLSMRHQLLERTDDGLHEELADVLSEVKKADADEELQTWLERRFGGHAGFDFQITTADGRRFFASHRVASRTLPVPRIGDLTDVPTFRTVPDHASERWRMTEVKANGPSGPLAVQIGRSASEIDHEISELLMTFLFAGPFTILTAVSGGYFLAGRVLRPVQQITRAAEGVSAHRLNERIAVTNPDDELGELAIALNRMMERLEASFLEMQRFTADAAHELRTPLAIIRNELEVTLRGVMSAESARSVMENLLEDTNRLTAVAEELLFLSRQDAGVVTIAHERVRLDTLLGEVVESMRPVAANADVRLELQASPEAELNSDGRLLRRVLINVVDNAIKYTRPRGRITVNLSVARDSQTVVVEDTGIGISDEHLPNVFDRFYQVDAARSDPSRGSGLGLSICQSIVRSLGGSISIASVPDRGTIVTIRIPKGDFPVSA